MTWKWAVLFVLCSIGCGGTAEIDIDTAQTGLYEAHTMVVEDTCTWDGAIADYPTTPWRNGVFVDKLQGVVSLPFLESGGGVQRFELRAEEDFQFQIVVEQECGSETQDVRLVELSDETVITQRDHYWTVETGCETGLRLPDTTCSTRIEHVMSLEEPCDSPCEIRFDPLELACVCE